MEADFWRQPAIAGQPVDIMLPKHFIDQFARMLDERRIQHSIMIEDVNQLVASQFVSKKSRNRNDTIRNDTSYQFNYGEYHTYEEASIISLRNALFTFISDFVNIGEFAKCSLTQTIR